MDAGVASSIERMNIWFSRPAEIERFVAIVFLGRLPTTWELHDQGTSSHHVAVAKLLIFGFGKSVWPTTT